MNKLNFTIEDLEKKIKYFSDNSLRINNMDYLADDKILIYSDKKYVVTFYDIHSYSKLEDQASMFEFIKDCGISVTDFLDYGIIPYESLSYKLVEYDEEASMFKQLENFAVNEQKKYGKSLGEKINKFHNIKILMNEEINWQEYIRERFNKASENYTQKRLVGCEYIFEDIIRDNLYVLGDSPTRLIHGNLSLKYLRVDEHDNIYLLGLKEYTYGDPMYDLAFLWEIGIDYPDFAKAFINGYFKNHVPRKIFTKIAVYNSLVMIELMESRDKLSDKERIDIVNRSKKIASYYCSLDNFIPDWYKN